MKMQITEVSDAELAKLKTNQRVCLHALLREQMDYKKISQTYNMPVGTVKSRINRARHKVEKMREAEAQKEAA